MAAITVAIPPTVMATRHTAAAGGGMYSTHPMGRAFVVFGFAARVAAARMKGLGAAREHLPRPNTEIAARFSIRRRVVMLPRAD